jgi:mono/diheme cytochrome c family protein
VHDRRSRLAWLAALILLASGCADDAGPTTTRDPGEAVARGGALYVATCQVCHGPSGEGIPGMGDPLAGSEFLASRTDAQMVQFLIEGRAGNDPENRSGIAMPPLGGNPRLSTDDLYDIVEFLRSLE